MIKYADWKQPFADTARPYVQAWEEKVQPLMQPGISAAKKLGERYQPRIAGGLKRIGQMLPLPQQWKANPAYDSATSPLVGAALGGAAGLAAGGPVGRSVYDEWKKRQKTSTPAKPVQQLQSMYSRPQEQLQSVNYVPPPPPQYQGSRRVWESEYNQRRIMSGNLTREQRDRIRNWQTQQAMKGYPVSNDIPGLWD